MFQQLSLSFYLLINIIKNLALFLITLLFFSQISFADSVIELNNQSQSIPLDKYISIYEDITGEKTINDVNRVEFQKNFSSNQSNKLHRGFTDSVFWIRLHMKNISTTPLETNLVNKYTTTSYFDAYLPDNSNQNYRELKSGFLLPYSVRANQNRKLLFKIKLNALQEKVVFLRYQTVTAVNLEMNLYSNNELNSIEVKESVFLGAFYGLFGLLLISNIVIFFFLKKKIHLFISSFIAGLTISYLFLDGIAQSWLGVSYPNQPMSFIVISSIIGVISLLPITRSLNSKVYSIRYVGYIHNSIIVFALLTIIIQLIFGYSKSHTLYFIGGLLTPLFMFSISIYSWIKKNQVVKMYIIGLMFLFLGYFIKALINYDILSSHYLFNFSPRIGMLIFSLLMTLSLIEFVQWLQSKEKNTLSSLSKSETQKVTSEEKFTKIFYHLPVPMQIIDYKTNTRVAINNSYADLIGYSIDEIMGTEIFSTTLVSDPDYVKQKLQELVSKGELFNLPVNLTHKSGKQIYTLASAVTLQLKNETLAAVSFNDITELKSREAALQEIAMGVSAIQNGNFFDNLIIQLANVFEANYAFIGLINPNKPTQIDTHSFCKDGKIIKNISYEIKNTPCEFVLGQEICSYPKEVTAAFPYDEMLIDMRIESYTGIALNDSNGDVIGVMVVMKQLPMPINDNNKQILKIFASRAASEFDIYLSELKLKKTQKKLELHFQQTPLAVIEWNIKFEVSFWNPAAEDIFGYTAEEAIGKTAKELIIPPALSTEVDQIWQSLLNQKNGNLHTNENITKQGKLIYCEWHNTPLVTEQGEVIGVASFASDITSKHNAELELIIQEQQQRAILSSMIDGLITIDSDGLILNCNQSAQRITGYSEAELIGLNIISLTPKSVTNQFSSNKDFTNYLFKTHNTSVEGPEVIGVRKDQTEFPMRISIVKQNESETNSLIYIGTFQDLTRIKRQEEQLRRSQKMDALGKLTGGIAHDFNNLLGVIIGYSDLLDKTIESDTKQARYSAQIHRAAERGAKLTKKLLGFSRTKRAETTVLNINQILMAQSHLLEKTLTSRIKLQYELEDELWKTNIDAGDFEDAILNLCINAMHAIEGSGQITIHTTNKLISASDAKIMQIDVGEYVLVQVTDSGCGIEQNVIERIFDPFFTTKGDDGTGLGLSQVYGFVKNSNGALKVYSERGHGTQMNMYFKNYEESENSTEIQSSGELLNLTGSETILVLDDEEAIRAMSEEILLQNGYKVYTAESAEQALQLLKAISFDLVLSDVIMPKMDGYQFAKIVQKEFPQVKIQLASGFTDDRQNNIKHELYFTQLLQKPYSAETLLITIRKLLDSEKAS
jgi:PAS domain S-box-containing protein